MSQHIIFPIQHNDIYQLYKKATRSVWFVEEIDFTRDREDFATFNASEQKMLKFVMAFFASGDSIVNENILARFMVEVPFGESRLFYGAQAFMECIHTETYAFGIEACVPDTKEQFQLFHAIENMDSIKKKSKWAIDHLESATSLEERMMANVITEGVFFQGAFAIIFWFKKTYPGKLRGIVYSNELISCDEALHADHSVMVYKKLPNRLPEKQAHALFESAMQVEREFVTSFMDDKVLGLKAATLIQFLEHVCDHWLEELGYLKKYNVDNPLPYMDTLGLRPHTNFFERKNREYVNAQAVSSTVNEDSFVSSL